MSNRKWILPLLAGAALTMIAPGSAWAGFVYINGVPVSGMKNQKFEGCTVAFDAKGNVQITAPGVKIKAVLQPGAPDPAAPRAPLAKAPIMAPRPTIRPPMTPPPKATSSPSAPPPRAPPPPAPKPKVEPKEEPPPPNRPGPLTQRYFLVAIPTTKGVAQYDVDVYINKRHAKKVRNRVHQLTFEVTKWLHWGRNEVQFAATKNLDGKPRISSSSADFMRILIGSGVKGGGTVKLSDILADFRAPASKTANFGASQNIDLK